MQQSRQNENRKTACTTLCRRETYQEALGSWAEAFMGPAWRGGMGGGWLLVATRCSGATSTGAGWAMFEVTFVCILACGLSLLLACSFSS